MQAFGLTSSALGSQPAFPHRAFLACRVPCSYLGLGLIQWPKSALGSRPSSWGGNLIAIMSCRPRWTQCRAIMLGLPRPQTPWVSLSVTRTRLTGRGYGITSCGTGSKKATTRPIWPISRDGEATSVSAGRWAIRCGSCPRVKRWRALNLPSEALACSGEGEGEVAGSQPAKQRAQ